MATTKQDELQEKIQKQEERIRDIQKDLFSLANYYFVFQGVIFTAVFNSSTTLKCKYRWLPITLSLTAGLLNFITFFQISQKYLKLLKLQDISLQLFGSNEPLNITDDQQINTRPENGTLPVEERPSEQGIAVPLQVEELAMDLNTHKLRRFILYLCMLLFFVFIAVNVIACGLILCQENNCNNYYGRNTCLNLCDQEKCVIVCPQD